MVAIYPCQRLGKMQRRKIVLVALAGRLLKAFRKVSRGESETRVDATLCLPFRTLTNAFGSSRVTLMTPSMVTVSVSLVWRLRLITASGFARETPPSWRIG